MANRIPRKRTNPSSRAPQPKSQSNKEVAAKLANKRAEGKLTHLSDRLFIRLFPLVIVLTGCALAAFVVYLYVTGK